MHLLIEAEKKIRAIAANWESGDLATAVREAVAIADEIRDSWASPKLIELAKEWEEGNDEIEIDDQATTSDAMPGGIWVQAWVWVNGDEYRKAQGLLHEGCECAHCNETIDEEADGTSSPHGSMHIGCAAEHEAQHPDQW